MEKETKLNLLGQFLMLTATIVWGTSFFILKETISAVPMFYVIAIRFFSSAIILFFIFFKHIIKMPKSTVIHGIILGLFLASAYLVQTLGLSFTTPSRNAFLTASYCVMVPFMMWIFYKQRPTIVSVICAVLCLLGIGLVGLTSDTSDGSNMLLGDFLSLLSGLFFGFQIIYIYKCNHSGNESDDTGSLLFVELLTVGVIMIIISLVKELPKGIDSYALNTGQILKIAYLTLICTCYAQLAQMFGQKHTTSNQASLILSLEAVFGTLFSVILGDEKLALPTLMGFLIIFVAMLLSEVKIDFKKLFKLK